MLQYIQEEKKSITYKKNKKETSKSLYYYSNSITVVNKIMQLQGRGPHEWHFQVQVKHCKRNSIVLTELGYLSCN